MKMLIVSLIVLSGATPAAAYEFKDLSAQDLLVIGSGLDKLPREATDANGLYQRLQAQIAAQNQATEKDAAAKRQAEIDAAVKAKTKPSDAPTDKGDKK